MTDREQLIRMDMDELAAEVRIRSNRLTRVKRAARAGVAAPAEVEQARMAFYIARGIHHKLTRYGAA